MRLDALVSTFTFIIVVCLLLSKYMRYIIVLSPIECIHWGDLEDKNFIHTICLVGYNNHTITKEIIYVNEEHVTDKVYLITYRILENGTLLVTKWTSPFRI
ncbi:MAG: hypothetical protein DRJ32_07425 [Thermoprotei archaeon]|nr:MAG: hypothetical protein DRJ32_07425 [Thermoprotei archaeon]